MKRPTWYVALVWLSLIPSVTAAKEPDFDVGAFNECLLEKIKTAGPEVTAEEIRAACLIEVHGVVERTTRDRRWRPTRRADEASPLDERMEEIKATEGMDFVITPYKPNYLLVGYNPDPNATPFQDAFPDENIEFDATEIKFQISFMFPVVHNIFGNDRRPLLRLYQSIVLAGFQLQSLGAVQRVQPRTRILAAIQRHEEDPGIQQ